MDELPDLRLWRLDRIISADLLDRGFQRRPDFSLVDYVAWSLGVFQEEPLNVTLRFTPEAADDASLWIFHPAQRITREKDASLTVRFRAGGVQEICWHLFTWGSAVTIVSPESLGLLLATMTKLALLHHTSASSSPRLELDLIDHFHKADVS